MSVRHTTEVLIIGTGLAGCTAALKLADAGCQVMLISPTDEVDRGNSNLAQGGIIYSQGEEDHRALEEDITIAGHHINHAEAVNFLADEGYKWVEELLIDKLKIPFEKDEKTGTWAFTREGGHSNARILHCHDYTGKAIMAGLLEAVEKHENITLRTKQVAIDLLTIQHSTTLLKHRYQLYNECLGCYVLNEETKEVEIIIANNTILATGGVGQVYLHSTNSQYSVGSGISMAQRAGVRLMNTEYVQFHPTSLFHIDSHRFLITEAMRGEGAILRNKDGHAFMEKYDSRKDLAPRDIVAKAIVSEMLQHGDEYMYLDFSPIKTDVSKRFPTIYSHCQNLNIDLSKGLIPIVPAAHYFCGGILVDLKGKTSLNRLYAVGECACTGIHGKNRLASTSLLEALLWGASSANHIIDSKHKGKKKDILSKETLDSIPDWDNTGVEYNDDPALIAQDWAQIKTIMWNYVGIVRTKQRVRRAFNDLRDLSMHLHDFYKKTPISSQLIRLFHGAQTAYIISQSALRHEKNERTHYPYNDKN